MALYKAVTTRKGHAASVRRQSRQRLRRERRYRRNRSVRFYRHLARTGSAFPRLPRRFAPRNDNLGECRGAPAPLHGLIPLYKALATRKGHAASVRRQSRQRLRRERRYTPYFGVCRFHGRLYGSEVRSRERHAAPLQWCTPFNDSRYELEVPFRDCTPRALPRASRSGRHVALLLAMTNLWLSPFYR